MLEFTTENEKKKKKLLMLNDLLKPKLIQIKFKLILVKGK